jgi:hypothetical protein
MRRDACIEPQELLAYWLGELDAAYESRVDEHLFACAACSAQLAAVVSLGEAIRAEVKRGDFGYVVPTRYIRSLEQAGLRVREYEVAPGGSVSCTITPDDDLVASTLRAPLHGVRRLDVLIEDPNAGAFRLRDVAFDPNAESVTVIPSVTFVRAMPQSQQRMKLVAVDGADERVIADYTFNHTPS